MKSSGYLFNDNVCEVSEISLNEFENNPSKKPPVGTYREASAFELERQIYPGLA